MIQRFTDQDYSKIYSIWEQSVVATHHFLSEEDFDFYKEKVPVFFPMVTLYVYEEDDLIKGFLGVSDDNIEMLFVAPQYFGKGVGRALLLFAAKELKLKKVDVNQQNTKAFDFYKKFGFEEMNVSLTDDFGKPYPISHLQLID